MTKTDKERELWDGGFRAGAITAIILMTLIWWSLAWATEKSKVDNGYLTYCGSTYTVTLFDTLDKPKP